MKLGCFIPIRTKSTRILKKPFLSVDNQYIFDFLASNIIKSKFISKKNLIFCITNKSYDDDLFKKLKKFKYRVFRGSEKNIIERFYLANKIYKYDLILEIDGDDIFTDYTIIDKLINNYKPNYAAVITKNLPLGLNCKLFSKQHLENIYLSLIGKDNETGFSLLIEKYPAKKKIINFINFPLKGRFTIDYKEDFIFFLTLYYYVKIFKFNFTIKDYSKIFKLNNEIFKINSYLNKIWIIRSKKKMKINFLYNSKKKKLKF